MKKLFGVLALAVLLMLSANLQAWEVQFRLGPTLEMKDWPFPAANKFNQFKFGVNFASTSKGAESGFYSSNSIDFSFLEDTTIIWLTPEFQYDIKIGGLPLYIYPKFGLVMFFAFFDNAKSFGFGIKPAVGIKFDLMDWFYVWAEPFGVNIVFTQYYWLNAGWAGFATGGWLNDTVVSYDMMFGVGFRL